MANNLLNGWEDVQSDSRLELVFKDRFRNYGAYQVRKSYTKNKILATVIACGLALLLSALPLIIAKFSKPEVKSKTTRKIVVDVNDIPEEETKKDEEKPPPPPPKDEVVVQTTTQYTVPTIDPETNEKSPPPDFSGFNPGAKTQKGSNEPFIPTTIAGSGGTGITTKEEIITNADIPAAFVPGGDAGFRQYVKDNFVYPTDCFDQGINGAVVLKFVVNTNGSIGQILVESETKDCPEFTTEAIRILRNSPKWIPAMYKGKFVTAWRRIPINITINQE